MAIGSETLTFGNVNSEDYKIHISGGGTFDGAKRVYETVKIPGRNGAFYIDDGSYENIQIAYPAFICETEDETEFRNNIAAFRNALGSLIGYQRLEDDYHPDEYRMAVYMSEMEPEPVMRNSKANFTVNFDCKPQRFLKSGATAVSMTSGDTLTNPTRFDASPLIMVDGYGDMTVNGYPISIDGAELIGEVSLGGTTSSRVDISSVPLNTGDTITVTGLSSRTNYVLDSATAGGRISDISISVPSDLTPNDFPGANYTEVHSYISGVITFSFSEALTFQKGTAKTYDVSPVVTFTLTNSTTFTPSYRIRLIYDGADTITFRTSLIRSVLTDISVDSSISSVVVNSTKSILGAPIYIDCDLGECYKIENDTYVSLNSYIALGADLPVLSPGENEITFDSTYESVEIVPRWWQL